MSKGFHSFAGLLRDLVLQIDPDYIIEWGPGESTRIIREAAVGWATIYSIEHDQKWYQRAVQEHGSDARMKLIHRDATARDSSYATVALEPGLLWHLAFVDGRRRVECVLAALTSLNKPIGRILIHDWCRANYRDLISRLPHVRIVTEQDNCAVLAYRQPCPSIDTEPDA